jgi:hypothetical protein
MHTESGDRWGRQTVPSVLQNVQIYYNCVVTVGERFLRLRKL